MNRYRELKDRQQAEFNEFSEQYMFYAFNDAQAEKAIAELMQKNGIDKLAAGDIVPVAAGGYILRAHYGALKDLFNRQEAERRDAIAADHTGEGFIYEMFLDEMFNREFALTGDIEELLTACGLTAEEFNSNDKYGHGFILARDYCIENTN